MWLKGRDNREVETQLIATADAIIFFQDREQGSRSAVQRHRRQSNRKNPITAADSNHTLQEHG